MPSELKRKVKSLYAGVSWQNPLFRKVLPVLDIADLCLRHVYGRRYLPRYSYRIRSNGIKGQFGGRRFVESGAEIASLLRRLGNIDQQTDVLDIGCGCGRVAFALADYLGHARYTGMDVDRISIEACRNNPLLDRNGFHFLRADVANDLYNLEGQVKAREYTFPFPDDTFDVVFLHSVFTHMLPEEVARYTREISRVLRSGGRCIFTTFLADFGIGEGELSFPHDCGSYCLHQEITPLKAVSYRLNYLDAVCADQYMSRHTLLTGMWRQGVSTKPDTKLSQDVLLYEKR